MIKKIKKNIDHRAYQYSIVIEPRVNYKLWLTDLDDFCITNLLMNSSYPLHTEVKYILSKTQGLSVSGKKTYLPLEYSFGTEEKVKTNIPHYQCWLKFPVKVRRTSVFNFINNLLVDRAHVIIDTVYGQDYSSYCLKASSDYSFNSSYYWRGIKMSSNDLLVKQNRLINLRGNLMKVKNNYYSGQVLLKKILLGEPDDRSAIWINDPIGGTGKTAFMQTIIDDPYINGIYVKITEGLERLSSKVRKKIQARLDDGRGYPKVIWINFGRTVTEADLKTFADFCEQLLDGMLDDNFGNSGGTDFFPLPYMNLIVTGNTPPNMKQLTSDRLKLLTFFPIYKDPSNSRILSDSLLIPVFSEIRVRFIKRFNDRIEYKFLTHLQGNDFIHQSFNQFSWYLDLLDHVKKFKDFKETKAYQDQFYQSKLETDWIPSTPNRVQEDVQLLK